MTEKSANQSNEIQEGRLEKKQLELKELELKQMEQQLFRIIRNMRMQDLTPNFINSLSSAAMRQIAEDVASMGQLSDMLEHLRLGNYCQIHEVGPEHTDCKHDEEYDEDYCDWDEWQSDHTMLQDGYMRVMRELGNFTKEEAFGVMNRHLKKTKKTK
jgi:hypothetical protein